ncbi:cadherin-related family member 5 precursor [Bos taurus]|uniref:Cadherin-related family member 5 n=1 Tax=Bos taurus TaxID=9913 RepID=A7E2Z4_BOVIN|nr:cadherin-related family member 5 precursor [Bos taurus]AAI51629.1 MUPCDH protein [Bos taurus]
MGTWVLLLPLLFAAEAQAQAQVCSVDKTSLTVKENTNPGEPLLDIYVPQGQQVTLGPSSTLFAFRIQGNQLFLNVTPDYEANTMLLAHLECRSGDSVVTQLRVFVSVLDVNDNPPRFPYETKLWEVPEDTRVNTTVISETELEAQDQDKDDVLFYTLQEVTLGASSFFSLVGANRPALRLDQSLDLERWPNMTFRLLARDTQEETTEPSHTATATLVLEVQPVDLRPPWFLPCSYSDGFVCIHAEYHGAVPTGHRLPDPLILHPGPVYAMDGDQGINQPIKYSIISGNEDSTFSISVDSGNLTMTKSIPNAKTFLLVVKGEQADNARYSVTQVTVEARNASGSMPHFTQSLYRGTVGLGSGAGVVVKDAADPSQPLRIRAQDPEFPDLNSAITYRITNNSDFRMDGEAVLTATSLEHAGVFYAEVEANNTVTSGTATTVVEIQIQPSPTGPPGPPTSPETAGTTRPSSGTTLEVPRPPEPSQGSSTTSSGGDTGLQPSPGTTLTSPASSMPSGPPSVGTSPSPPAASPSGGSATRPSSSPTSEAPQPPEPSQGSSTTSSGGDTGPHPSSGTTLRPPASSTPAPAGPPSVGTSPSPTTASPSGASAQTSTPTSPASSRNTWTPGTPETDGTEGRPVGGQAGDRRFSEAEMAVLGGVLGALLLLALIALAVLVYKNYGHRLTCGSGRALEPQPQGFDNQAFLNDSDDANWAPAPSPSPSHALPAPREPEPPEPAPPSPETPRRLPEAPAKAADGGSPAAVRSILTKERRPEGGYKAVWFGEDIGAEADVVVLNTPASEAGGAGDSGSEGSGDEAADAQDAPGTYSIHF